MIEIGPHGLPRLMRPGAVGTLTTEHVRQMMDEVLHNLRHILTVVAQVFELRHYRALSPHNVR